MSLDHERLDVYRVSLDFAVWARKIAKQLNTAPDRNARDHLIRASQSIVLNLAEGCGKFPSPERVRFLQIACGSARECGAILDLLVRSQGVTENDWKYGKTLLERIVAMLTRMARPIKRTQAKESG